MTTKKKGAIIIVSGGDTPPQQQKKLKIKGEKKMNTKQFTALKKEVKNGNLEGLKKEAIQELTLKQAQGIEDLLLDLELSEEGNQILDIVVAFIDSTVTTEKKVANKKAPKKETTPEAPEATPEAPKKEATPKKAPKKESQLKGNKQANIVDKIKVGTVVKFRVEEEEIEHNITIVNIGKYNIIGVMQDDEKEVFNIRKSDFNKQVFGWRDRNGEEYNIIVTL